MAHEIGHLILQQSSLKKILAREIEKISFKKIKHQLQFYYSPLNFLEELLIESLAPISYLTDNYFEKSKLHSLSFSPKNLEVMMKNYLAFKKGEKMNIFQLRRYFFWQIYPLTVFYITNRKKYDVAFLKIMVQIIKNFLNENRWQK